jgi:hypothetical protein
MAKARMVEARRSRPSSRTSEREIDRMALELYLSGGVGVMDPELDSHLDLHHGVSRYVRAVESPDDIVTGAVTMDPNTGEITCESYSRPMTRREAERKYGK